MADKVPDHHGNEEVLKRYWTTGEGGAKIRWGEAGDFDRCRRHLEKYMPGRSAGFCNLLHHRATGMWPAEHAKLDRAGRNSKIRSALTKGK